MSNGIYAKITIGGQLEESLLTAFLEALNARAPFDSEELAAGYLYYAHDRLDGAPASHDELRKLVQTGGPLTVVDKYAPDGQMDTLTTFCRQTGLTYTLFNEETTQDNATLEQFRPDFSTPTYVDADVEGDPVFALADLERWLQEGVVTLSDAIGRARSAVVVVPPFAIAQPQELAAQLA